MRIAIRVDASTQIGSGHVMRCATLAGCLKARGAEVVFLCRELPGHYCDWLEARGDTVHRLPAASEPYQNLPASGPAHAAWLDVPLQQEVNEAAAALAEREPVDWLVVDHYALDAVWESAMRFVANKIMVIDDLADRSHDADLLLDQNLPADPTRYDGRVPASCLRLIGSSFALLRPEFARLRASSPPREGRIRRLLVFLGGGDARNVTCKVLDAVAAAGLKGVAVDVVLGQNSPYSKAVQERCNALQNCEMHVQTNDMAGLMARADFMIGGAGSTTWERFCLGLPALLLSIAANQRRIGSEAARHRGAFYFGDDEDVSVAQLASLLRKILDRPSLVRRVSSMARRLVDGLGADRVAAALIGRLRLSVVSDGDSWINNHLSALVNGWRSEGHEVTWVHDPADIPGGDCAFFLGCSRIAHGDVLARNVHNLVVHESDLPRGRGWSPLTWQILEGAKTIPVTLFEAGLSVDTGVIYEQQTMDFAGHELVEELRAKQADATIALCQRFVHSYPAVVATSRDQRGVATHYSRRRPEDSRLDPARSIADQFNLLRVVDNQRYPAWFEYNGHKYLLKIEKVNPS